MAIGTLSQTVYSLVALSPIMVMCATNNTNEAEIRVEMTAKYYMPRFVMC